MAFLDTDEKAAITQQIRSAEAGTSGEIVTIITQRSDDYTYIPLLWATLAALSLPGIYFLFSNLSAGGWQADGLREIDPQSIYLYQVALFFILAIVVQWEPVKMRLIPRQVRKHRAAANARSQFLSQHLHWTEHRTGILIFVSLSEHYVEIIVDQALAEKVPDNYWQKTVDRFINDVRSGATARGFSHAIDDCQKVLWEHFPAVRPNGQTLPDHLIEV
ncbi:MAG: TPM domain-containing protein [Gammaproteobacteria bacterium]|nr:TPM domain-containing protein [Gammaproteobacteria bacterium]